MALNREQTRMLATRSGDTYLVDVGNPAGRPVIVLHGGLGLDHGYLRPAFDQLGDEYRVLYYDHLGNGRSERELDYDAITTNQIWIDQLSDVISMLELQRPIIVGHSYGGYLTLSWAAQNPDVDAEFVLLTTSAKLDHLDLVMENARKRGSAESLRAVEEDLARPQEDDADWERTWRALLPMYFHDPRPEYLAQAVEGAQFSHRAFNTAHLRIVPTYNTVDVLPHVTQRTLVMAGDDDWILPLDPCSLTLAAQIPNADLAVIPAAGHFPFVEQPEAFLAVLRGWLRG